MSRIYPASWFRLADAESDPIHSVVCKAAGVSATDEEISVCEITDPQFNDLPTGDAENASFFYVSEVG